MIGERAKKLMNLKALYVINVSVACLVFWVSFSHLNLFQVKGITHALSGFLIFASISLGFFGTCVAILATLINSPIIKEVLRDAKYKIELLYMFLLTVSFGLLGLISTVIFQVYNEENVREKLVERILSSLWLGSMVGYLLSLGVFYAVIMFLFFKSADENPKVKAKKETVTGEVKNDLFKS